MSRAMNTAARQIRLRLLYRAALSLLVAGLLAACVWLLSEDSTVVPLPGISSVTKKMEAWFSTNPAPVLVVETADDGVLPEAPVPADPASTLTNSGIVVLESAPEPDPRSAACLRTTLALAEHSPREALRWVMLQPREYAGAAIIAAAYDASRQYPTDALNALAELPPSAERDAALTHAASQWGALEPKAAAEWTAELPPGNLREQVCTAVAIAMADRDPWTAADFVASQITDGMQLRTAAVSVAQRWAQREPAAASAWGETFPEGPLREDILREILVQQQSSELGASGR